MSERVVLLHGLWMPAASMALVARRLEAAGFKPELFGYRTVQGGPEGTIPRLAACLRKGRAHIVAHSLGGLVALATLGQEPTIGVGRVVCLGSPLSGSSAASGVAAHAWGQFALGRSVGLLRDGCAPCAAGVEVGVVAGRMPVGLGRFFAGFRGDNDGTVAVEETRVKGLSDHVTVRASHLGLLVSDDAAAQTVAFLRTGRFVALPRRA